MAKFLSGRQKNLKIGISSYSENLTSLEVIGKVGIGSTVFNPVADLDIRGSLNVRDTLTVGGNLSVAGIGTINTLRSNTGIVTTLSGTNLNYSGIGTINTLRSSTGIVTSLSGTNLNYSGISTLGVTSTTNLTSQQLFVSGVSTFIGAITGTISTATKLQNARTVEITGDIVASPISFNGTGNVSLAATIQPNSVGLGTDTFGDYVKVISGTSNQIDVTGGTGEGSTPVISFAPNPTIPGNVTIGNDLQVNNNLNVTGNITVGGTSGFILVENFKVSDADIILGFTTDFQGNDVSNDTTANHGGISVASTEGNPLVNLNIVGIETLPPTYKKIMWFKAGAFAGLNTDAWLSNYAIGIGSTQFPSGTRLAAGSVQFTENDLAVVRNINASGVVTATSFRGDGSQLTGVTGTQVVSQPFISTPVFPILASNSGVTSVGIATTGSNALVFIPSSGNLGIGTTNPTSKLTVQGDVLVSGVVTATSFRGDGSQLTGVTGTQIVTQDPISTPVFLTFANNTGVTSLGVVTTGSNVLSYIPSSGNLGIGTTNPTSKLDVRGDVLVSGISTLGTVKISSGIVTASSGIVTYYGDGSKLQGIISTAGISVLDEGSQVGTSVTTLNFTGAIISVSNAVNGISTVTVTESGIANYASVAGIATYASNAGIATYASNAGIATYASVAGIATYASNAGVATYASNAGISTNVIGGIASVTQLSVSGISTLGTVQISSGIITATSGVVTYYGDGSKLTDILASSIVGVSSFATNAGIATNLKGGLVGNVPYQSATDTTVFLTNGSSGTILQSNGIGNAPSWVSAAPAAAITGLTIRDEGTIVGSANSVSELNFVGAIVSATSSAGIATITFLDYVSNAGIATFATNAGISTFATNAGIATFATNAGIATFATNAGISTFATNAGISTFATDAGIATFATNAGIATFATNAGISTFATNAGIATFATNAGIATFATNAGISTFATNAGIATFATNAGISTNVIGGIASVTQLNVSGVSTLGIVTSSQLYVSGVVTASQYFGDGSQLTGVTGVQIVTQDPISTPVFLTFANNAGVSSLGVVTTGSNSLVFIPSTGNLGIGTTNPTSKLTVVGDVLVSGASTLGTVQISSGIVTATTGIVTYYGDGSNLQGIQASSIVGVTSFATNAGIATFTSEWILGEVGSSDYTFTGPGFTGAESDPVLYLVRGQQYKFTNTMGAHPFRIQSTPNGSTGTQYNDGIVNNNVSNGTLTWNVQFDAPGLLYYQCTAHGSMGGKIYIIDAGIGPDVSVNTTGIITAASFSGDGSQLTGVTGTQIVAQDPISTPVFLTFANNAGVSSLGVATTGSNVLSYIPSTGNLGIGTTNPTSKLDVRGDVLVSGVVTATQYFGDGSQLTGVTGTQIVTQDPISTPVFLTFANNAGVSSLGVATTGSNALALIPSTGNLGIGTINPYFKADIVGDARITSNNKMRFGGTEGTTNFYIQYNSSTNSLDFVAG